MAAMVSTNSYNTAGAKGLSGLVSGMDTQSMVEKMLAGTQAKINKQNAAKQLIAYKQAAYRDTVSKLRAFQTSNLSFTSNTNLMSQTFFNTSTALLDSKFVKVEAGPNSSMPKFTIDSITKLATSTKIEGGANSVMDSSISGSIDMEKLKNGGTLNVVLDGISKNITLDSTAADESAAIASLQDSLTKAFGSAIKVTNDGSGAFNISTIKSDGSADTTRQLIVTGDTGATSSLGLAEYSSTKMNLSSSISNVNFKTELVGTDFKFQINGVSIEAKAGESMRDVMDRINNSDAGVKVSYSSINDKFTMESNVTGAGTDITLKNEKGNLLSVMFGTGAGSDAAGAAIKPFENIKGTGTSFGSTFGAEGFTSGEFKMKVNGVEVNVSFAERKVSEDEGAALKPYSTDEITAAINAKLADTGVSVKYDNTNGSHFTFSGASGKLVEFGASPITQAMGFADGSSNKVTAATTAEQLGLSGELNVSFGNDSTFPPVAINLSGGNLAGIAAQLQNAINTQNAPPGANVTFNADTGQLIITGVTLTPVYIIGQPPENAKALLGGNINLNTGDTGAFTKAVGTNAEVSINGQTLERSSNSFEYEGSMVTLQGTTNDAVNVTINKDTDKIVAGIKSFVNDYNKLVTDLQTQLKTTVNKDYPPLTAEQKKDMTESEIKLWEEKATAGMLHADPTISGILDNMRAVMYQKPEGAKYALYEIGIATTSDWKNGGFLEIDEDKLRSVLEQEPNEVQKLFTDETAGVAVQINRIIDSATKNTTIDRGSLVSLAGVNGLPDSDSLLAKQMKNIDDVISSLKRSYETEKTRYWKQFSRMETILNQMNQQSSWLTSQLG